jgi:hypothetical protein
LTARSAPSAARLFIALNSVVIAFQLALVAGVPWGHLTMGGAYPGSLPTRMRLAAAASGLLLLAFSAVVATRAGLILPARRRLARRLIWGVVAYMVVGTVANAATPSYWERVIWLPVVLVLAGCSLIVARAE